MHQALGRSTPFPGGTLRYKEFETVLSWAMEVREEQLRQGIQGTGLRSSVLVGYSYPSPITWATVSQSLNELGIFLLDCFLIHKMEPPISPYSFTFGTVKPRLVLNLRCGRGQPSFGLLLPSHLDYWDFGCA